MKPWEKYSSANQSSGPWSKYGAQITAPEANISVVDPTEGMSFGEKALAGAGKAFVDVGRSLKQTGIGMGLGGAGLGEDGKPIDKAASEFYGSEERRQKDIEDEVKESRKLDEPLMSTGAGVAGNIGGHLALAAPSMFAPGANTFAGSSLAGAILGALQPTTTGESKLGNAAFGAAIAPLAHGAGRLVNKTIGSAGKKLIKIESNVATKAAEKAASETASARSAAGNAAQNAYKQLEHLRELGSMRALTAKEAQVAAALEKELAGKAAEKLIPAAAQKELTKQAYKQAMETETQRAADLAKKMLSGGEVKSQVMARIKRYGPAALGGMAGNLLFPGLGGMVGGAATGLVLRPAIRSVANLAKNPAVQHKLLSPIANIPKISPQQQALIKALLLSSVQSVNSSQ